MQKGSVKYEGSKSEKQSLLSSTDHEDRSGKQEGKKSPPAKKPDVHAVSKKDSPSILSSVSSASGKSQPGQTGEVDGNSAKAISGKSKDSGKLQRQLTNLGFVRFDEVESSWKDEDEVDDNAPLLQHQGDSTREPSNAKPKSASKPVYKKDAAPKSKGDSNNNDTGTVVEISSEDNNDAKQPCGPSPTQTQTLTNPTASASGKPSKPKGKPDNVKTSEEKQALPRVSYEEVKLEKEKKGGITKEKIDRLTQQEKLYMDYHRKEILRLMTAENTKENAETVYQKVAQICTDRKLEDWLKLPCLLGMVGSSCNTLKKEVNQFFDGWVIEKYLENHAPKSDGKKTSERRRFSRSKQEEKRLLSEEGENGNDTRNGSSISENESGHDNSDRLELTQAAKAQVLKEFKSTLSWNERRKINSIKSSTNKNKTFYAKKSQLQELELMRKMQKRLTEEERKFIKDQTKIYHDLLENSGLPALHIAIKNESTLLVSAYLKAVMAFAPFEIKNQVIQARRQDRPMQAFYYAMTHSSVNMVKIFIEEILHSEFLFLADKMEILHARMPDTLENGTYGVSAFYMAMYFGDPLGTADIFMSTLLGWDPNCEILQHSRMKLDLLSANKSYYYSDCAKKGAHDRGHKALVKRFDDYVNSSHLSFDEKNILFYSFLGPLPELKYQPRPAKLTPKQQAYVKEVLDLAGESKMPGPSDPVEYAPGKFGKYYDKQERRMAYELSPKYAKKKSVEDEAIPPFKNAKKAGRYATFFTCPEIENREKRRTDGDRAIGVPPRLSQETIKNTLEAKEKRGALPSRSSSYVIISNDELPAAPKSVQILPALETLSPPKHTPNSRRQRAKSTSPTAETPTKLSSNQVLKSTRTSLPPSPDVSKDGRKRDLSIRETKKITATPT